MTNLLTVSMVVWSVLSTNTETKFPTKWVPDACPQGRIGCLVNHQKEVPVENPTEKTEVTTVKKTTFYKFDCCGESKQFSEESVVTNWVQQFTLKTQWEPVTNWLRSDYLTNWQNYYMIPLPGAGTFTNTLTNWQALTVTNWIITNSIAWTNRWNTNLIYFDQRR